MSALTRDFIARTLFEAGLIDDGRRVELEPMTGGVSSEIWKVETGGATYCVKRALDRLKVQAEWRAPVERNLYEVRWNRIAARVTS